MIELFASPVLLGLALLGVFLGITVGAVPGLTGTMLIALALPLTLLCAVLSWHWIERPALTFVREGFLRGSLITRRIAPRR